MKYNNEGGSVHALLKPEGEDKLRLTISDTGIGIPKDKQGRVFERFYRAEESRNKSTGGSGLGLAICKHIVEKHKGTLSMTSEEGKGTTVTVILPRMSDADVSKETKEALTARQEAEDAESGRLAQQEAEEDQAAKAALGEAKENGKEPKHLHKAKKLKKDKKTKKKSNGHSRNAESANKPDGKAGKPGRKAGRKKEVK